MNIYIWHLRKYDFQKELYEPIKNSSLFKEHNIVLPHDKSDEPFSSKKFFQEKCDLFIAEVSFPATGLWIELWWADAFWVPILCIHKKWTRLWGSLKVVTSNFIEYDSEDDMIEKLKEFIENIG